MEKFVLMKNKVTMSWGHISQKAKDNVAEVLESGWLSRRKFIPKFEMEVSRLHNARYGILMNSGTDALRISLLTLKEIYKWQDGDEVIVPALTFVATVNAILQANLKPVFADVNLFTANIDINTVASQVSPRTSAVLAVHLFGLPVSMPAVTTLCKKLKLSLIEDSCETFGVHKLAGDMMCMSFYMSHHVATGVGGMILTNSKTYEKIARSYANHGRTDDGSHFEFGRSGYSSRITELEAAIGCAALERFDEDLKKRKHLAEIYYNHLFNQEGVGIPALSPNHSWMFFPIFLHDGNREKLMTHLRKNGIENREAMPLISQPIFRDLYIPGSCPVAEEWTAKGLLLPLHPQMSEMDVEYVSRMVKGFFK